MPTTPSLRIFLDTNVIFSGLRSPAGVPASILQRCTQGELKLVTSPKATDEVYAIMGRKLPGRLPALRLFLVAAELELVEDPSPEEIGRWSSMINPGDAVILAASVAANVDYLVTGDKHFFENPEVARQSGLRIVTPAQLLDLVQSQQ